MNQQDPIRIGDQVPEVLERYQLKALPTFYGGITYRSRIEARWAIFLDSLRLKFEYEREGFDLGDGVKYLPDFWLPQLGVWIEIKGQDPNDVECDKASRLAVLSGHRVYVFFGGHVMPDGYHGPTRGYAFFKDGSGDHEYCWCECPTCGKLGIEYHGRSDRLPCKEPHEAWLNRLQFGVESKLGCRRFGPNGDKGYNYATARLCKAFQAARAARFGR